MSFLDSSSAWTVHGANSTLLDLVGRVMRSAGITKPTTLAAASDHTMMAIGAIDAAAQRIWYEARWDWRSFWVPFEAEADSQYLFFELPSRYAESGANPVCSYLEVPLYPRSYQSFILDNPRVDLVPFEQMSAGYGLTALNIWQDFLAEETNIGLPNIWGIHGSHMFLYPVVDQDALDSITTGAIGTSLPITFNFYGTYASLINEDFDASGADDTLVEIPDRLLHILHHLALGYFQSDLEYPGAGQNEGRGERMLAKEVARHRKLKRDSAQFRTTVNKRAW